MSLAGSMFDDIPNGCYKQFILKSGREVRVWGNEVIEGKRKDGRWLNEKKFLRFTAIILEQLLVEWDEIPTVKSS